MAEQVYAPTTPTVAAPALDRLLHLLLPAPCLACGSPLPAAGSPLGLCAPCRGRLRPLSGPGSRACPACARPLPPPWSFRGFGDPAGPGAPGAPCGRCASPAGARPAWERLLALWRYEPPLDAVVAGLKFRRLDYLGLHLAEAAAAGLGEALATPGVDVAVPVPLHWRRRLARGFNQAEVIARPLARHLGIPCAAALARPRATPPQTSLGRRERLGNVAGAFRVRRPRAIAGRRVLLVDDVATTGATLDAAARALLAGGAAAVTALVAGRTPDRG